VRPHVVASTPAPVHDTGEVAIRVEGLGKRYRIGSAESAHQTFREMLSRRARAAARTSLGLLRGRTPRPAQDDAFWALSDVSFDVRRGEVVGIIGLNGAGKSTLLKVLSRVTEPTRGRVTLRGRVASLLEVGTGFHPELTGRENVYLNGAILGMTRAEIDRKFDAIVDFAEVERFLNMPVKRYSSGMYVRLAFAVAAHLEPEILIIDEVLAVGDVVFQKKCIGKMQSVAGAGRTVLFVSHNMQTITGLTQRAVLLREGRVAAIGPSADVVQQYLQASSSGIEAFEKAPAGMQPEITRVQLHASGPGSVQQFGKPMTLDIELWTPEPVPNANVSFQIMTNGNQPVCHVLNLDSDVPLLRTPGVHRLRCRFPRVRLFPGHYHLSFSLGASEPRRAFPAPGRVCPFEVAVLDQIRDFYWEPGSAAYVEDVVWSGDSGASHAFPDFSRAADRHAGHAPARPRVISNA
jgi:lipopolysaccharide transport system ATP-binding protein